jgi:hypothetical protein
LRSSGRSHTSFSAWLNSRPRAGTRNTVEAGVTTRTPRTPSNSTSSGKYERAWAGLSKRVKT